MHWRTYRGYEVRERSVEKPNIVRLARDGPISMVRAGSPLTTRGNGVGLSASTSKRMVVLGRLFRWDTISVTP
jgi:hypothetical protein